MKIFILILLIPSQIGFSNMHEVRQTPPAIYQFTK
jgi:hypothetical protein